MIRRIFVATPLTLYGAAMLLARYAADDWCELIWHRDLGLGTIPYLYGSWSGKFSFALQIALFKTVHPALFGLAALGAWVGLLWLLFRRFDLAVLLPPVTMAASRGVIEAFYWQSGMFGYLTGLALLTLLTLLILRDWRLPALLLAFITAGTTDTVAVVLPATLPFFTLLVRRKAGWWAFAGALVGLVIMVAAPGNAVRRLDANFPYVEPFLAVSFAVRASGVPFANALRISPAVIGLLALPAFLDGTYIRRDQLTRAALLILLGVLSANVAAELASYFALGHPLVGRAESIPLYITLVGGLALSALAGQRLRICRPGLAKLATALVVLVCTAQATILGATLAAQYHAITTPWGNPDWALGCAAQLFVP